MMFRKLKFLFGFVALFLFRLSPSLAGTCALCRQSLAVGGSDGLVQGIYLSILLIAGMPFMIAATFFCIYHKKTKKCKKVSRLVPSGHHFDI